MGSPATTAAAKGTPPGQILNAQEGRLATDTAKEAAPSSISGGRQAQLQTPPGTAGSDGAFGSAEEGPFGSESCFPLHAALDVPNHPESCHVQR